MFFADTDFQFKLLSMVEYHYIGRGWSTQSRDFDVLSFRMKGSARYEHEEQRFSLGNGDLMYIPANAVYQVSTGPEHLIVFHFQASEKSRHALQWYTPRNPAVFRDIFQAALNTWEARRPGYYQKTMSLLYKAFAEMSLQFDPVYNSASYARIKEGLDCLHENYRDSSLTVEKLCQICSLSDTQFRKCFQDVYGTTPLHYINQLRVDHAADLLLSTHASIEDIALKSGFADAKYFASVFRKYRGQAPTSLRRKR